MKPVTKFSLGVQQVSVGEKGGSVRYFQVMVSVMVIPACLWNYTTVRGQHMDSG